MDWQHMIKVVTPRWGWALTGSGHFFNECIEIARQLEHVDLFVSKAAGEVLRQY
jgi:flavoprotein